MQALVWILCICGGWLTLGLLTYALFYPLLAVSARCAQDEEDAGVTTVEEVVMSNTGLSERELEVLRLKAAGLTGEQIAHNLSIAHQTVRHHVVSIVRKLEVCNIIAAVVVAIRDGDIDPDSIEILRRS